MTELEKVIKGLEACIKRDCRENACPYGDMNSGCLTALYTDALELLKAKYKPREPRKMLPCKCGCKRREHWYGGAYDTSEGLKCMKCGFTVWGKDSMDVIRKWNEAVKQNDEA